MKNLTPMMRQYFEIKNNHPDKYIFFRLGDFYELFEQDAIEVSKILQITLTERGKTPMCGFPHHQLHRYAHKVISQGKKIVIAEQMEKNDKTPGLVERKVSQIITPGTTLDEFNLLDKEKNFIVHFSLRENAPSLLSPITHLAAFLVAIDISTGETVFVTLHNQLELENEIARFFENYSPREVILFDHYNVVNDSSSPPSEIEKIKKEYPHVIINYLEEPNPQTVANRLDKMFKSFGDNKNYQENFWSDPQHPHYPLAQGLCLLLNYAESNQNEDITYLQKPKWISSQNYMKLDSQTLLHLEIFKNNFDHTSKYSLLSVVDHTLTPMGARKLQEAIALPSLNQELINYRLNQTEYLYLHPHTLKETRNQLKNISDLERIGSRIVLKKVLPKEFVSLKKSFHTIHQLFSKLLEKNPLLLNSFKDGDNENPENLEKELNPEVTLLVHLAKKIEECLLDSPNNDFQKGGVIKPSFHPTLNEYFLTKKNSEQLLGQLENKERVASGISSLKIKYNDNLGFFFETRKNNLENLPSYFIPKQSLINCERFVSKELIALEGKILEAREKSFDLEKDIFLKLREELSEQVGFFQSIANKIANLDLICSFAELAITKNYVKPQILIDGVLSIKGGRHPVIEENIKEPFIPNDLELGSEENTIEIITGPNMSGKSTFLRQNALIVILAQIGSFVPAQAAMIPLCDNIFTRIGSGDRLVQGESTFLVEMKETANILHQVTPRSLVIMDEIGRGTSTYDGIALAWSIIEYLNQQQDKRAKTLFATHYHELISLAEETGISHYHVAVKEEGNDIIFLKKVIPGMTSKSYGIHVASLAGMPNSLIERAKEILKRLENKELERESQQQKNPAPQSSKEDKDHKEQHHLQEMKKQLLDFDLNNHSPLEAMQFLASLIKRLK